VILPDVNVLVYAYRPEALRHDAYATWLEDVVAGREPLALHDAVLSGFLRVVTNPRIFPDEPTPTSVALEFVHRLLRAKRARWMPSGHRTWDVFGQLVEADRAIRANLVPDAHLAAAAIAHGCRLATTDRGFARFPGLRWFDPAAG
jgi:toxin-antitoxin system PIN domain toxin